MIIPAQVPNVGMPDAIRLRSGSNSSNVRASLAIVVDSPPGMTSPSHASSSDGRRTGWARTPSSGERAQVLADVALEREDADRGHARTLVRERARARTGELLEHRPEPGLVAALDGVQPPRSTGPGRAAARPSVELHEPPPVGRTPATRRAVVGRAGRSSRTRPSSR